MGKSMGKLKKTALNYDGYGNLIEDEDSLEKRRYCHLNHIELIGRLSDKALLEIGKYVCATDFVVRFYNNKKHVSFYKNRALLEKAIRRSYGIGAFNHRDTILDYLMDLV